MSEIIDFYQQQAKKNRSSIPWLAQMQTNALTQFIADGFPNRHQEEWKYTSVDAVLKTSFAPDESPKITSTLTQAETELPTPPQITIDNGIIIGIEELKKLLPKGVIVLPLSVALQEQDALIKSYLGKILKSEHGLHALNTAMMHCGLFIYIPPGVTLLEPIIVQHRQDQYQQAVYLRHLFIVEDGSHITLVEDYVGAKDSCYMTNGITELFIGSKAQVGHYKIQRESKQAFHFSHLAVQQSAASQFASQVVSLGGKLVRSDLSIALQEEQAQCFMNGIYMPTQGQHIDHHTTVNHLVPNCSSEQDYKGVLKGKAKAVFNGKVIVAKNAQHTVAKQQNKNILLSAEAEINTKPQLEIFADDVICSHGATVGQLDEEALFYLATRGIDRLEATRYLIHAFTQANLRAIPEQRFATWIDQLLTQQLEQ